MNEDLFDRIKRMKRSEYTALKKSQKKTRIIGAVLFAVGGLFYPVLIMQGLPVLVAPVALMAFVGLIMFINSFTNEKYTVLKYVKFEDVKEKKKKSGAPQPAPIFSGSGADSLQDPADGSEEKDDDAKEEEKKAENNRILGCLIGGAAGDALGYAVEFVSYDHILKKYGKDGITSYSIDPATSKALISDDTQMTLFTAEGLLEQEGDTLQNIYRAYKNWRMTQSTSYEKRPSDTQSELLNRQEMYSPRAPGNTCLSALAFPTMGTIKNPINSSKGCGGVMRVAPIAFLKYSGPFETDKLAAQAAAITHGHPLGYLPAALLVHILHKAIYEKKKVRSLNDIIHTSIQEFRTAFSSTPYFEELMTIVNKAVEFSGNRRKDIDNIRDLGQGWVAEETLAIAVYCALRHQDDFSAAMTASVNHDGDSDSTGAVTGNILGAYLGEEKIDAKWKESLELYDLITKFAERFGS